MRSSPASSESRRWKAEESACRLFALADFAHHLVASDRSETPDCVRLLQVVRAPSIPSPPDTRAFELCVCTRDAKPVYLVAQSRWDVETDRRKLATEHERRRHPVTLIPTILRIETPLDIRRGKRLHAALDALRIPLRVKSPHRILDGTSVRVTLGAYGATSSFTWTSYPPDEWKPLGDLVDELETLAR